MTKLPTINIQGKPYVTVAERVKFFNDNYSNGAITTELLPTDDPQHITIKATVIPDIIEEPQRFFTGYSHEVVGSSFINKTSALENCETSAVGRALAFMGIGIIDSIASADELNKARNSMSQFKASSSRNYSPTKMLEGGIKAKPEVDPKQLETLNVLLKEKNLKVTDVMPDFKSADFGNKIKMEELIDAVMVFNPKTPPSPEGVFPLDIPA